MTDSIRAPIRLSDAQVEQLRRTTQNGFANYPAGYALIHGWIKGHPAAQRDGTVFWFEQAQGINAGKSLSAIYIRRHTENGLNLTAVPHDKRQPMQALSDLIAHKVIYDILRDREIASLPDILSKDISVALREGKVSLGGWGGSFYYWDMPFKAPGQAKFPRDPDGSYRTVGEEILRRGERELVLDCSARTLKEMVLAGEIRLRDAPQILETSWNAGMPAHMKAEVTWRATRMVAEHVIEQAGERADESLRAIPKVVDEVLQQQRRRLLDGAGEKLEKFVHPQAPRIPRVSAQAAGAELDGWAQIAGQLDAALRDQRHLARQGFQRPTPDASAGRPGVTQQDAGRRQDPAPAQSRFASLPDFAPAADLHDPAHPGHREFARILSEVHRAETARGIASGPHSERVAAALLLEALRNGHAITNVEIGAQGTVVGLDRGPIDAPVRKVSIDAAQALSLSMEHYAAQWAHLRSPHFANRSAPAERTPEQAHALAQLPPQDRAMFALIREAVPAHLTDDVVAHAMLQAKRDGMTGAPSIERVVMVGDTLWIAGTTPGFRAAVDLSAPPPDLSDTLQNNQAFNQQRQLTLDATQREPQQAQGRGLSA